MPKLEGIIAHRVGQSEREGLDQLLNKAVSDGIAPAIKAVQDALHEHTAALKDSALYAHTVALKGTKDASDTAKAVGRFEQASAALSKAIKDMDALAEGISVVEAQILAEIRAIKFPEPKPVSLKPVLDAIKALPEPEKVVIPEFPEMPQFPEFPEIPKPKAVVPVRYPSSSSMHPLVERYELEY